LPIRTHFTVWTFHAIWFIMSLPDCTGDRMNIRISLAAIGLVLFCSIGVVKAADESTVGFVKTVSGQAFIERNGAVIPAKVKDALMANDALVTGRSGSLGVIMQDNGVLAIASNTRLVISTFIFKPAEEKLSFIAKVIKGKMVYLTGLIARLNPGGVKFETPTAMCGVRGTHFAISVDDPGN
jgi:hypothetical protein